MIRGEMKNKLKFQSEDFILLLIPLANFETS